MALSGLLALLDDVTAILDDVATLSKVAAQKTAGIAGDDLAVNAQGLVGIEPSRELPIVGKVALGSFLNKLVLIPIALMLPASWITPLLVLGGIFLCYEGVHKILHKNAPAEQAHRNAVVSAARTGEEALAQAEKSKVKQAITTDVVLSAEIIAVSLAAVANEPLLVRAAVLAVVGVSMTLGIYGLVALIVKLDDIGLHLQRAGSGGWQQSFGSFLVEKTPWLMRFISIGGTFAMFLVGGGILLHGIPGAEAGVHHVLVVLEDRPLLQSAAQNGVALLVGIAVGLMAVGGAAGVFKLRGKTSPDSSHP